MLASRDKRSYGKERLLYLLSMDLFAALGEVLGEDEEALLCTARQTLQEG